MPGSASPFSAIIAMLLVAIPSKAFEIRVPTTLRANELVPTSVLWKEAWLSPESCSKAVQASPSFRVSTASKSALPASRLSTVPATVFWFGVAATSAKAASWVSVT